MNYKKILLTVGSVALLLFFLFLSSQYSFKKEIEEALEIERISQQSLKEIIEKRVLYIINKGQGNPLEYRVVPSAETTVFSLLQKLSQREGFEISYTIYPEMGVLVESINGLKNGTEGKYWQYWVNGELPMVSADNFKVREGDKVEWKFEVSQF